MQFYCHNLLMMVDSVDTNTLDAVDLRLLGLLQDDASRSNQALAEAAHVSPATALRRVRRLEEAGIIDRRVALLDRSALGLDVTIFAHVKLSTQGRDAIAAFAEAIRERPEVLDCYTTMGEWDFMLRVVTRDIKAYEAFYLDHLSKLPNVQSINSSVTVTVIVWPRR